MRRFAALLVRWLVAFEIVGNAAIYAAHLAARRRRPAAAGWAGGAANAFETTSRLWRSGRPTAATYEAIAGGGVGIVVDLRAEGRGGPDPALGLRVVHVPIVDGRAPSPDQVAAFRAVADTADGPVLVHCSAGVGRTGSMVAARLVLDEGWSVGDALVHTLAIGPPSLEQIEFVRALACGSGPRPWVVAAGRVLDAPRRAWSRLRQSVAS